MSTSSGSLSLATWNYVAMSEASSGRAIFLNNAINSGPVSDTWNTGSTYNLTFGRACDGDAAGGSPFSGNLSEVRISTVATA